MDSCCVRQTSARHAGIPVLELFHVLFLLVFYGKNLLRFLHSEHNSCTISKNAFCRFLGNPSCNRHRFLLLLAVRITKVFRSLTGSSRKKMLVLDDSVLPRNCSKSVELLARVHDHVTDQYLRGFNLLPSAGRTASASFPWRSTCSPPRRSGTAAKRLSKPRPSDEQMEGEDG